MMDLRIDSITEGLTVRTVDDPINLVILSNGTEYGRMRC